MIFAILTKPVLWKFFVVFFAWIIQQIAYVIYGIYTKQFGFLLIGIFEILIVFILFILSRKVIRDNFKS